MPRTIAPPLIHFPEPQFDGRRVLYAAREGTELRLNICQIPPLGKTCVPQATDIRHPFHLSPKALANGIVLYEDIDIRSGPAFSYRLWGCALEPATGACPPVLIQTSPGQFELDFSEGRIVWSEFTESGSLDILFCRFDAIHQTCPIQRLSGDPSRQSAARIDEHRVVWEDDREGEVRIASFALPTLGPLRPQQVNAGRPVAFEVVETSGVSEVQVTGLTETGAPLASLGVRITQAGPGRSYVRWRPGDSDVGTHVFLFRASLPSGLMDERAVQIDVLPSRINR